VDTGRAPDAAAILHVDLDAFFASVEVLDDPTLAGRPVVVGGLGARGVVAACTYEARRFGVHSAMPMMRARSLCPQAVYLAGRHERYGEVSARFHAVLHRYTPLVEGISLDEAFLDVTGAQRLFGAAASIAAQVRAAIHDELGLDASVGVAATKFMAKLASEAAKPRASPAGIAPGRGVVVVDAGTELTFLHPLPVQALWGVGPATLRRLERFGVRTVGDLAALPRDTLVGALGPAAGQHLHDLAWARDPRPVEPDRAVKSVSQEETYASDLFDRRDVEREAVRLADGVGNRLRRAGLSGRTVTVKVRYHDFATITRAETVTRPIAAGVAIARVATALLAGVDLAPGVRLLGVGVSNLSHGEPEQLSLASVEGAVGDEPGAGGPGGVTDGWERATGAVDRIRARFGDAAVGPAAMIGPDGLRRRRSGQWGPGAPGSSGPAGSQESSGSAGSRGSSGPEGSQESSGSAGPQGSSDTAGSRESSGSAAPPASSGGQPGGR